MKVGSSMAFEGPNERLEGDPKIAILDWRHERPRPTLTRRLYRLVRAAGRAARSGVQILSEEAARLKAASKQAAGVRAYIATHDVRYLHVGAGTTPLQGWLNVDFAPKAPSVVFMDVAEPLPLDDNSIDLIFTEHLMAEISHEDGAYHLSEAYRVLKTGGRIRIATPDLQFLLDLYFATERTESQERFLQRTLAHHFPKTGFHHGAFVLNHFLRGWSHFFVYDEVSLTVAMRRARFSEIRRYPVGVSDDPRLQNIEQHGRVISDEFNVLETMVLEGVKGTDR